MADGRADGRSEDPVVGRSMQAVRLYGLDSGRCKAVPEERGDTTLPQGPRAWEARDAIIWKAACHEYSTGILCGSRGEAWDPERSDRPAHLRLRRATPPGDKDRQSEWCWQWQCRRRRKKKMEKTTSGEGCGTARQHVCVATGSERRAGEEQAAGTCLHMALYTERRALIIPCASPEGRRELIKSGTWIVIPCIA